jgi:Xaa-Pro aminopeptidase
MTDVDRPWYLRRQRADELALIRRAIDCTAAMYAAARSEIRPGITELELFNVLQAAAVNAAGEPLTHPIPPPNSAPLSPGIAPV